MNRMMNRIRYIGSRETLTPEQRAFVPPSFNPQVCAVCMLFEANKLLWEEEAYAPLRDYCSSCDATSPVEKIAVREIKYLPDLLNFFDARMISHLSEAEEACAQIDETLENIEGLLTF